MLIYISYIKDVRVRMSEFSHYQLFHESCHWVNFNQSANSWDLARSCSITLYGLSEVVLHSGGAHIYDVIQQASWRPPCGIRFKCSQLYKKKSNMSGTILYGLSSSTTPSINLLSIFFSLKLSGHLLILWTTKSSALYWNYLFAVLFLFC